MLGQIEAHQISISILIFSYLDTLASIDNLVTTSTCLSKCYVILSARLKTLIKYYSNKL